MLKKKYFNILFIFFVIIGLTGHVFGTGTSSTILPDTMTPEQKILFNYIMDKSGCDVGEATLVIQMLCDQLSKTDSSAFMLYMMNPNGAANLPGLNPQYTWNDYFTHDSQFIDLKNRFDDDLRRFGGMTHEERLEYCKHSGSDFIALMNELTDSGDIHKINYVFENGGLTSSDFDNELNNIGKDLQKDGEMVNSVACKNDAERLKSFFNSRVNRMSEAMINYDYLKANGTAPKIYNHDIASNRNLDIAIENVNICNNACVGSGIITGWVLFLVGAVTVGFACATTLSLGAMAPLLTIFISIDAFLAATVITLATLSQQLIKIVDELYKMKDSLP